MTKKALVLDFLTGGACKKKMLKRVDKFLNKSLQTCHKSYDFDYIGLLF